MTTETHLPLQIPEVQKGCPAEDSYWMDGCSDERVEITPEDPLDWDPNCVLYCPLRGEELDYRVHNTSCYWTWNLALHQALAVWYRLRYMEMIKYQTVLPRLPASMDARS